MIYNCICRIIEGTQENDVHKVLAYSKKLISEYEKEHDDINEQLECIKERFNPNSAKAIMDNIKTIPEDFSKVVDENFWNLV